MQDKQLESMEPIMSLGIQIDTVRVDKPGIESKVQAALWVELVT
jgi:hypothetical protein